MSNFGLCGLPKNFKIYDQVGVETRRGCKYRCVYCTYRFIQNREVRFRPEKSVVEELESLRNNFDAKNIFFADCIFHPSSHIERISDLMINREVDVNWTAFFREDSINKKLVEKIVKSGCTELMFSPDSGSQKILNILQKDLTPKQILDVVKITKDFKELKVWFNMYLNVPGETIKTVSETLKLSYKIYKSSKMNFIKFSHLYLELPTENYPLVFRKLIKLEKNRLHFQLKYSSPPLNYITNLIIFSNIFFNPFFYKYRTSLFKGRNL